MQKETHYPVRIMYRAKCPSEKKKEGVRVWEKSLLIMPGSHIGAPVQLPATPLLIQYLVNVHGKAAGDVPSVWVPAINVEELTEVLGSYVA